MNNLDMIKVNIMAQHEWLIHMREVIGVDTSGYPYQDIFIPELGITHRMVFIPNDYREAFHEWFQGVYWPKLMQPPEDEPPAPKVKVKYTFKRKKHRK